MFHINDEQGREIFATSNLEILRGYLAEKGGTISVPVDTGDRLHACTLDMDLPEKCSLSSEDLILRISEAFEFEDMEDAAMILRYRWEGLFVAAVARELDGNYGQAEWVVGKAFRRAATARVKYDPTKSTVKHWLLSWVVRTLDDLNEHPTTLQCV